MKDFSDDYYLLEQVKSGDNKAFEYLFRSYYPRLYGYAIRFVDDEESARDIIQECFIRFWEKREVLKAVSLTSLLFAMVHNSCLNYLKHQAVVEHQKIEYLATIEGEEKLYHVDFCIDNDHKLLYQELEEQINMVIGELPERCREIFLLSRFEGLKNREIAEKLKISTTAVEKHIAKALLHFTRHFKEKYPIDIYIIILAWLIAEK